MKQTTICLLFLNNENENVNDDGHVGQITLVRKFCSISRTESQLTGGLLAFCYMKC